MAPEERRESRVAAYRDEEEELWIEPVLLNIANVARWRRVGRRWLDRDLFADQVCSVLNLGLVAKAACRWGPDWLV